MKSIEIKSGTTNDAKKLMFLGIDEGEGKFKNELILPYYPIADYRITFYSDSGLYPMAVQDMVISDRDKVIEELITCNIITYDEERGLYFRGSKY